MIKAFVTWKNPTFRKRYIIGELTYDDCVGYKFKYCKNIKEALKAGFKGIGEFKDLNKTYESTELFLTFSSRIPDKKRKDFKKFLQENKISETVNDLEILFLTKAALVTDTIEIFQQKK